VTKQKRKFSGSLEKVFLLKEDAETKYYISTENTPKSFTMLFPGLWEAYFYYLKRPLKNQGFCMISKPEEVRNRNQPAGG
jgi:hypothetical protein